MEGKGKKNFKTRVMELVGGSVYWRIFIAMAAFFALLAVGLVFWISGVLGQNQRMQLNTGSLHRMETISLLVDQSLEDTAQSMSQLMWNNEMIRYMVAPVDQFDETGSRDYRIIKLLQSACDQNDLVKRVVFYSPLSGQMYCSDAYSVRSAHNTSEWFLLNKEADSPGVHTFLKNAQQHTETLLYTRTGEICLIQKLNIGNHIGTLLFEIDRSGLAALMKNAGKQMTVYPYDGFGAPLFRDSMDYGSLTGISETGAYLSEENLQQKGASCTRGYYYYQSPQSGLQYLAAVQAGSTKMGVGVIFGTYVPLLLILCLLSILFTAAIREIVYQPINRLMALVGGKNENHRENEFNYLEAAYSDIQGKKEYLAGVLNKIAPDMLEMLLRHIVFGRQQNMEEVCGALEMIDSPIPTQGNFVTAVCSLVPRQNETISAKTWGLYYVSLQQAVTSLGSEKRRVMGLRVNESTLALAICMEASLSEVEVKQELNSLSAQLQEMTRQLPYSVLLESGRVYRNILGLRDSFEEARERLRYQQYLQQDQTESPREPEAATTDAEKTLEFGRFYYREQVKLLVRLAATGKNEKADSELTQLIEALCRRSETIAAAADSAAMLLDELLEKLISYPLSEEEQKKMACYSTENALRSCESLEQLQEYVLGRSRELLCMIGAYARKSRYKYVSQAKEYIHANYTNSSLSLNDVAEHTGISASYLSELFNEIAGEKFSVYLAKYRVEKAQQLQSVTNLTVKEIGFQCGFNSSQNFIRVYKKYTGHTPGKKV